MMMMLLFDGIGLGGAKILSRPPKLVILVVCFLLLANSKLVASSTGDDDSDKKIQDEQLEKNRLNCDLGHNRSSGHHHHQDKPPGGPLKCPRVFDTILCWEETLANVTARQICPDYVIGFVNSFAYAERTCMADGRWQSRINKNNQTVEYTNYVKCMEYQDAAILSFHLPIVRFISKIGSGISLASLVLAILILSGLKRLHCARNILHINLFASFLFFSIMQLIKEFLWVSSLGFSKDVIRLDSRHYIMNAAVSHWECKLFMSIFKYAESTEHAMIFSEALYLNTLVSFSTFNEKNHYKSYITLGWLAPLVWLVPYISFLAYHKRNSCWTEQTPISYIQVVPQCILILANFGLFINIVRILFIKLHSGQTDSRDYRYKKLAKSTLILLPLFGINYIMFNLWQPFVREKLSVELELARLYFDIVCNSFQGLILSLIYVFFNSEVRNEIIKIIERVLLRRNPNMRRFSKFSTPPNRERSISLNERNAVNRQSCTNSEKKATKKKSLVSNKSSGHGKKDRNHLDSLRTQEASSIGGVSEANSMSHFDETRFKQPGCEQYKNGKTSLNNHLNSYDLSNTLLLEKTRKATKKKFSFFNFFRRFKAAEKPPLAPLQATENGNGIHLKVDSQTIVARPPTLRVDSIDVHEIKLKTKRNSKRVKLLPPSEPTENGIDGEGSDLLDTCDSNKHDDEKNDNYNEGNSSPIKIVINGDVLLHHSSSSDNNNNNNKETESGNDSAFDESSNLLQNSDDVPMNDGDGDDDDDQEEHPLFLKHLNLNLSSLDFIDTDTCKFGGDRQESLKSKVYINGGIVNQHAKPAARSNVQVETTSFQDQSAPNGDFQV